MKRLNKKTFFTIFSIISIFLFVGIIIYNFQIYKREYESVRRNLNDINRMVPDNKMDDNHKPKDIDNMIIMDYEVYTVYLNNNKIDRIISHSNNNSDFDIDNISIKILNTTNNYYVGNLYLNKYSYNKTDNMIIIVNTKSINSKLTKTLFISLIIFIISEFIIIILAKLITDWITKPAIESYKKQKEFIADASHELKTPLAIIIASSDEIKENKSNKKYLDNIKYESNRMNKLISNLLELSKLENSNNKDLYKELNISKIVNKICLTFDSIAYEKSLRIVPNIEDGIMLKCIKDDIEKLISILIDNAIKHGYKNTDIIVNLYKKKDIVLEVINTGDSINKEDELKIFERFYRVDKSRNRSDNRYGLGLSIAKTIVNNHNGIIKATSNSDKVIFKVEFKGV